MRSSCKPIGNFICVVDERNNGLRIKKLLGLTISKEFIPSVANIVGSDMENYKIIRKNQFACSLMQVRRDKRIPIALLKEMDEAIISQAYPVFEIKNTEKLLPEYLMMWFRRAEFDREACFYAVGGVRGSLEWEDFCQMQLPVPPIEKQEKIVKEYNAITKRISLDNELINKLEEIAWAIYKRWFEDFDFPDEDGNPYKSSGGEMVYNAELDKEVPKGWGVGTLEDIIVLNYGKALSNGERVNGKIKVYSSAGQFGFCNKALANEPTIIVGRKGSIGNIFYEIEPSYCIDTAYYIKESDCKFPLIFIFYLLKNLNLPSMNEDSAVPGLNRNTVYAINIVIPDKNIVRKYSLCLNHINTMHKLLLYQNIKLGQFQEVILSEITTLKEQ